MQPELGLLVGAYCQVMTPTTYVLILELEVVFLYSQLAHFGVLRHNSQQSDTSAPVVMLIIVKLVCNSEKGRDTVTAWPDQLRLLGNP